MMVVAVLAVLNVAAIAGLILVVGGMAVYGLVRGDRPTRAARWWWGRCGDWTAEDDDAYRAEVDQYRGRS